MPWLGDRGWSLLIEGFWSNMPTCRDDAALMVTFDRR